MYELKVPLNDILRPESCFTVVSKIIKYITYSSHQIPYNYEVLASLVHRGKAISRNDLPQRTKMQAKAFYKKIENEFNNFEETFKNLKIELEESPVKEVVLILGTSIVVPKQIYRICIPDLAIGHSDSNHSTKRILSILCRSLILSSDFNQVFEKCIQPTNMYVVLKMSNGSRPKTSWFLPNDKFRISSKEIQIQFSFETPAESCCSCLAQPFDVFCDSPNPNFLPEGCKGVSVRNFNAGEASKPCEVVSSGDEQSVNFDTESEVDSGTDWYQARVVLRGFKDHTIDGNSAWNVLLNVDS